MGDEFPDSQLRCALRISRSLRRCHRHRLDCGDGLMDCRARGGSQARAGAEHGSNKGAEKTFLNLRVVRKFGQSLGNAIRQAWTPADRGRGGGRRTVCLIGPVFSPDIGMSPRSFPRCDIMEVFVHRLFPTIWRANRRRPGLHTILAGSAWRLADDLASRFSACEVVAGWSCRAGLCSCCLRVCERSWRRHQGRQLDSRETLS